MYAASRRALLPSLHQDNAKSNVLADGVGIVCSQPSGPPSTGSTAAPSESSCSRRSSSGSRTYGTAQSRVPSCPAPPVGIDMLGASSQGVCWTKSIDNKSSPIVTTDTKYQSPFSGPDSPKSPSDPRQSGPRRPYRHMSDPTNATSRGASREPASGSASGSAQRAPSGSRTPTGRVCPPLSNAQLEGASQKLKNLEQPAEQRPNSRSGWDSGLVLVDSKSGASDLPEVPMSPITSPKSARDAKKRPSSSRFSPPDLFSPPDSKPSSRPSSRSSRKGDEHNMNNKVPSTTSLATEDSCMESVTSSSATAEAESNKLLEMLPVMEVLKHSKTNLKHHLHRGSRDDSFLSTISESTMSTDSTSTERDSKRNGLDSGQIEVYSAECAKGEKQRPSDMLKDFNQLFSHAPAKDAEDMQQLLHHGSFDKPLSMQRRIIPVIMSAFQDEQKSFITIQGAPQSGKTSALALGILGAVGADMTGIRVIALSTGDCRNFKKCFDICGTVHPMRLCCFESAKRKVSFAGVAADPVVSVNINEDMQRLCSDLGSYAPGMIFGHPSRVLPLLREAPSWGIDLSNVQVLALDDAEEAICQGLMDEVVEVCTILRHFSRQRLRHIMLSHVLSNESKSMVRCLRTSLLKQNNLFGIQAHRTQARAKAVNHYYAVAPRSRWPAMLAVLHHALSLPSGIIFDDESAEARGRTRVALRSLGVTASVWNALAEQRSGARAAARDGQAGTPKGPAFHLMPSDLAVLKVDLPQVRCILHFGVPQRELNVYGLRLMCLEQQDQKKGSRKIGLSSKSLSVLLVEETETVRELEKTFHIRMQEVPTDMLPS